MNISLVSAKKTIGSLALPLSRIILAMYRGTAAPGAAQALGLGLLSLALLLGLEQLLKRLLSFSLGAGQSLALLALALIYLLLCSVSPALGFAKLTLELLPVLILLVCLLPGMAKKGLKEALPQAALLFAAAMCSVFFWNTVGAFSVDSYSYYDISGSFSGEFGLVSTIRQYVIKTDYNISFPYFYPLCIFLVNLITGLGMYSGVYLNLFAAVYTLLLLVYASRRFCGRSTPGVFMACVLLYNPHYWEEVCAARAIPPAILLTLLVFLICAEEYLRPEYNKRRPFIAGFLAGLGMVCRFDGLVLLAFAGLVILLISKKRRLRQLLFYALGALLPLLPWVLYSQLHFGSFMISDNMGTWFYVETMVPNRILLPDVNMANMLNAPVDYFKALCWRIYHVGRSLLQCSPLADVILLLLIALLILRLRSMKKQGEKLPFKPLALLCTTVLFFGGKTAMYMLTGYDAWRYHVESTLIATLVFFLVYENIKSRELPRGLICGLSGLVILFGCGHFASLLSLNFETAMARPLSSVGAEPAWVEKLESELEEHGLEAGDSVFMLSDDRASCEYGCLSGRKTYVSPINRSWATVDYALGNYVDCDYILLSKALNEEGDRQIYEELSSRFAAEELSGYWLFEYDK